MKKIICILFSALLLVACGTNENTQNTNNNTNTNETVNNENAGQTQNIDDSGEKENNSTSIEEKEFYLIDEIINNIDQFDGKNVTVKGSLGMGTSLSDDGREIAKLNEIDGDGYIELEGQGPMQGLCEVLVSGTIVKKEYGITIQAENYNYAVSDLPAIEFPDPEPQENKSEFQLYQEAAIEYNNLNWNQLYLNPTSLDYIDNIFFMGDVKWIDVGNGYTELLLQTTSEDKDDTLICAYFVGEVYDIQKGDYLVIRGDIESVEGGYTRNGKEYSCANVYIHEYFFNGKKETTISSLTEEDKNFLYGDYSVVGWEDEFFDEYFTLTESTIGNYTYTLDSIYYSFDSYLFTSGDYHGNFPDIAIEITFYIPEEDRNERARLAFDLYDNSIYLNYAMSTGYSSSDFEKVN